MSVPNFLQRKNGLTQLNKICSIKHQRIKKPTRLLEKVNSFLSIVNCFKILLLTLFNHLTMNLIG